MKTINVKNLEVRDGEIQKKITKNSKEEALTPEELLDLYNAVEDHASKKIKKKLKILIINCGYLGMRNAEALQNRNTWFTSHRSIIHIPSSDKNVYTMRGNWTPKTEKGERELHLLDLLQDQKPEAIEFLKDFYDENPRGLMISTSLDNGLRQCRRWIKKFGVMIGKPDLHPHALRATFANYLVSLGVDAPTLQYYMGWAKLETAVAYINASPAKAQKDLKQKIQLKNKLKDER